MRICLAVTLVFLVATAKVHAQRLGANAIPQHYTLALTPSIAQASFTGDETIDLTLAAPARAITLNALELKLLAATANGINAGAITYDTDREQVTLAFPNELSAGRVALHIAFSGILNDKLHGFYLSRTKARNYAVTQFESTDARRAFPSFDEPAFKATFDISLNVDAGDTAISNMNVLADTPAPNARHTVVFARTPRMSTYLVAFLVGDFACSKGKAEGVAIRVCSTPDKLKLTKFALDAAQHYLKYYDRYFGIKYPLPKLDLIAIPDFEAGAMENFGAITYRETELLVDEKDASITSKKRVAVTVAHEMAHQWFGDLVTMQWWNNLWLNEGFATWMETKAAAEWHPEWHFAEDAAVNLNDTLDYDAVRTTRTIRAEATTPSEIEEMFDGIAYGKAGAVIGMVENWLGPEVFRQGVHAYLAAHLYANATAEDFWNAQTATARQPVDLVMRSFVDRPGVPLLRFADPQAMGIPVAQSRFFLDGVQGDDAQAYDVSSGWAIPVCLKATPAPACKLVTIDTGLVAGAPGLLFANARQAGYYRTDYSPAEVKAITQAAATSLSAPERIGFVGDRWALVRAGQAPVGDFLDLAFALKGDRAPQVLDAVLGDVEEVRNKIADPAQQTRLDAIVRSQLTPVYAALGPANRDSGHDADRDPDRDPDRDQTRQVRTSLFQALGHAGDPAVLAQARALTDELFAGKKQTAPDLLDVSVELAAANGDEALYNKLLAVSQNASDPGLAAEALELLTRFRTPVLVVRTLLYATSGQVRNQDSWILIAREMQQPATRELAWNWVQLNWPRVKAQLTVASGGNIVAATGSFCTAAQATQVEKFFLAHHVEAADRTLEKSLDSIDACVAIRARQEPALATWLARQPPN